MTLHLPHQPRWLTHLHQRAHHWMHHTPDTDGIGAYAAALTDPPATDWPADPDRHYVEARGVGIRELPHRYRRYAERVVGFNY